MDTLPQTPTTATSRSPVETPRSLRSPTPTAQRFAPATATATRNPISLRLYKVLGANFDDAATKEALETLSEFYAPTPPVNANAKLAVVKDADEDSDDEWGRERLEGRDTGVGDGAAKARKNLRRDVEARLAESSRKFLLAFSEVDQKLDVLQEHIEDMHTRCDEAQEKLRATDTACKYLLERAGGLTLQRQTIATRQSIISLFLARFTLSEAETEAITSREVPVGRRVFDAMDRCERIRDDCLVLLSGEGTGPRINYPSLPTLDGDPFQLDVGEDEPPKMDIMSVTSQHLEHGYEKVYRWCTYEFRQLGRDSQLEVGPVLREAVRRLQKRPPMLSEALKSLSEIRQTTLLNQFLTALTRGGPGGLPRPIELQAHDPTRYVGDMLAWVHQATAGEREFLEGLFGVKGDGRMVGSVRVFSPESEETEEERWIRELMDSNVEKLCMPLKVRVQQTIKSQEGSITSYKIANLLQFYMITMRRTIGESALLSRTLREITDISYKVFFDTIEAQGRSLLRFLHPPETDLAPPLALRESSLILKEIMQVYDSSLLGDEDQKEREDGFKEILTAILEPMIEMCKRMAELMKADKGESQQTWDKAVFLINCTVYLQGVLQPYSFTAARVEALESIVDTNVQTLTELHYRGLLVQSGLAPVIEAIDNSKDTKTALSRVPGASSQDVSGALQAFDGFLSTLDVLSSPKLALLAVPRLSTLVHRASLERVGLAYGRLCDEVRRPENKYEFSGTLLGSKRPFGQMAVLWQVLGLPEEGLTGKI